MKIKKIGCQIDKSLKFANVFFQLKKNKKNNNDYKLAITNVEYFCTKHSIRYTYFVFVCLGFT